MNLDKQFTAKITALHDERIIYWKSHELTFKYTDFYALVEQNHAWNYQLWLAEDCARREDKGFEFVYQAKRAIDKYNQQRNNVMESMDEWLLKALKPSEEKECPVHTETPGMIIDRLSILALKKYHMNLQAERLDVEASHRQQCKKKQETLCLQREQLRISLEHLLSDIQSNKRTFRLYHQLKMYNDPKLNPELYGSQQK